jgi:hypothetical protein
MNDIIDKSQKANPFFILLSSGAISFNEYKALLDINAKDAIRDFNLTNFRQQELTNMNLNTALKAIQDEESTLASKLAALSSFKAKPISSPKLGTDHEENSRSALATVAGNNIQNALDAISLSLNCGNKSFENTYETINISSSPPEIQK